MFPTPEQTRLFDRLVGNWHVQGSLTMGGVALPLAGRWEFRAAAGGWGVSASLRAAIEGMGAYEEDDLAGFDVETGQFHIYSLTNTSAVHDHLAVWRSPDLLELTFDGTQGGAQYREESSMRFVSDNEAQLVSTDYVGGLVSTVMEATLRRAN